MVQVSIYQTLRTAVRRIAAVVVGVLLALGLSAWVGFTWWSLGITIVAGLALGYLLHLGDAVLEVPISAMLILSVGTRSAATQRVVETFIGTAAGLVAGFVLTSPRVQPAEEAIEDLCRMMADLLDRMAAGLAYSRLADGPVRASVDDWLAQARALGSEIRRVDDALRQAEESTKLNPRSLRLPHTTITLRESLETLEHEAITLRVFARSLADSTRLPDEDNLAPRSGGVARGLAWRAAGTGRRGPGATAAWPPSSPRPATTGCRPSCAAAPGRGAPTSRTGSPSGWIPTRRSPAGRLAVAGRADQGQLDRFRTEPRGRASRTGGPGRGTTGPGGCRILWPARRLSPCVAQADEVIGYAGPGAPVMGQSWFS